MSIASALVAAQQKVTNAYTAVSDKGGTLPTTRNLSNLPTAIRSIPGGTPVLATKTITENGTYNASDDGAQGYSQVTVDVQEGQWSPDPLWWDIKTILQNDPDRANYGGSYIYLLTDVNDTVTFSLTNSALTEAPVAVKTSDGATYTYEDDGASVTHTWDKTKDKQSSDSWLKTRYVICYTSTSTNNTRAANTPGDVLYAIFGINFAITNNWTGSLLADKYLLQSFDFLQGFGTSQSTSFNNFCYQCRTLQKLPEIDTSNGTKFEYFLLSTILLKKIPDSLDFSNGLIFNQFLISSGIESFVGGDFSKATKFSYSLNSLQGIKELGPMKFGSSLTTTDASIMTLVGVRSLEVDMSEVPSSSLSQWFANNHVLINLKLKLSANSNYSFTQSKFISVESLQYIADNAPTVTGKTLSIGADNIARAGGATGTIISTLTSKGWTVR